MDNLIWGHGVSRQISSIGCSRRKKSSGYASGGASKAQNTSRRKGLTLLQEIIAAVIVVNLATHCFATTFKSRQLKFGHWRGRKKVNRLSCESEVQVARDIIWESGPGRDLKIFWRRAETSSLCKQTGRLPWACQPLPVPGIQPPTQCSIVPHQPTHSFWRNATNFANINYSDWYCADISAGYHI